MRQAPKHLAVRVARVVALLLPVLAFCPLRAGAATTFVIDPNQSFVTLSGEIPGVGPLLTQLPGSLTSNFLGTLEVDLDTAGFISFPGGGSFDVFAHPGSFQPGGLPADFAGRVEEVLPGIDAFVTIRDLIGDVTGSAAPLALDGTFSVDNTRVDILSGIGESEIGGLRGVSDFSGGFLVNDSVDLGSLTTIGNDLVLAIPFDRIEPLSTTVGTIELAISGQLVAVATVPEPSTFVLLGLGGLAFAFVCRRVSAANR